MPTKPASTVEEWASDGVYTQGPYAGMDTKVVIPPSVAAEGAIPGADDPMAAEHFNEYFSRASRLLRWVYLGSSKGEADAHVVETDSDGLLELHQLTILPKTGTLTEALYVTNPPGSNANAIDAGGGDSVYAILAHPSGGLTGGGIFASASGFWTAIVASGSDGEYAFRAVGSGAGYGGYFYPGPTGDHAIYCDGNVIGTGIMAYGGSSAGQGVLGEARHQDYSGVYGRTQATATSFAAGVFGEGRGSGNGVYGYASGNGWSLAAGGTAGTKAPVWIGSRASDPTDTTDGQLNVRSDQVGSGGALMKVRQGEWRGLWSSRNGFTYLSANGSTSSTTGTGSPVTASFGTFNAPKIAGKVEVHFVGQIGRTGTCSATIDLVDVTAGVIFASQSVQLWQSGAGIYERHCPFRYTYSLPSAGARTWRVDVSRTGGGGTDTVRWTDTHLAIRGVFD